MPKGPSRSCGSVLVLEAHLLLLPGCLGQEESRFRRASAPLALLPGAAATAALAARRGLLLLRAPAPRAHGPRPRQRTLRSSRFPAPRAPSLSKMLQISAFTGTFKHVPNSPLTFL